MTCSSLLADSITRIRNAQLAGLNFATLYSSKFVLSVLMLLKDEGFIRDFVLLNEDGSENYQHPLLVSIAQQKIANDIDIKSTLGSTDLKTEHAKNDVSSDTSLHQFKTETDISSLNHYGDNIINDVMNNNITTTSANSNTHAKIAATNNARKVKVNLKYYEKDSLRGTKKAVQPVITTIQMISKPGCRIYVSSSELQGKGRHRRSTIISSGFGFVAISTSKGLVTDRDAKRMNVGGEAIFKVN